MPIGFTDKYRIPYLLRGSKPGEIAAQSLQIAQTLEDKIKDGTLAGPQGQPGLPGMNAVPADTAVAGYVGNTAAKTYTALVALITGLIQATVPPPPPLIVAALNGSDQPTADGADVAVAWTSAAGPAGMWNAAAPTRLVATRPGTYFLTANLSFGQAAGGMRGAWFRKNGVDRIRGQSNPPPSAGQYAEIDAHNYVDLKTGDYIEVMATVVGTSVAALKANTGTLGAIKWERDTV